MTRTGLSDACVCRADRITIGTLAVTGSRALVLLAAKEVLVTGPLDLSGSGGVAGPGASARYTTTQSFSGGAGGSFASKGGNTGAATFGDPTLVPLLGGMTGQDAGGKGGGGGGALQITAGEQIQVTGTIDAGGGGGSSGYASTNIAGAGGGGSGGAILLEAPTVIVTGAVVANGGGGGGGGGNAGSGGTGVTAGHGANPGDPAGGGFGQDGAGCPLYGYVVGGDGGTGATGNSAATNGQAGDTDSRCIGAESFVGGGGGGGGVGRIRVNTTTGCQCGGTVSPNATFGTLAKH